MMKILKNIQHKNPEFPEAVFHLRCQLPNLACLGIDSISMSRYGRMKESIEVHKNKFYEGSQFLGKPWF